MFYRDCRGISAVVGNYGFYAIFLFWAGCTVIYFITATFFLPETKGRTLEEIEAYFEHPRGEATRRFVSS